MANNKISYLGSGNWIEPIEIKLSIKKTEIYYKVKAKNMTKAESENPNTFKYFLK